MSKRLLFLFMLHVSRILLTADKRVLDQRLKSTLISLSGLCRHLYFDNAVVNICDGLTYNFLRMFGVSSMFIPLFPRL